MYNNAAIAILDANKTYTPLIDAVRWCVANITPVAKNRNGSVSLKNICNVRLISFLAK